MKTIKCVSLIVSMCMVVIFPSYVRADDNIIWSCSAMGMVPILGPDELVEQRSGKAIFKANEKGIVRLICPVYGVKKAGLRSLFFTFQDGDGGTVDTSNKITAELRRVRRSDGHVETMRNATVDSNSERTPSTGSSGWVTSQSATSGNTIGDGFDFGRYYYYVQVTMTKGQKSGTLATQGVYLQN